MIYTIVGLIGALMGMSAYALMVAKKIEPYGLPYLMTNLVAASLVAVSNLSQFNLPSVIMQAFYISVTLYGLWKYKENNATT